jgi:hypothetical protein
MRIIKVKVKVRFSSCTYNVVWLVSDIGPVKTRWLIWTREGQGRVEDGLSQFAHMPLSVVGRWESVGELELEMEMEGE